MQEPRARRPGVRAKEIIPRDVAHRDVDEAVTHYLENASGNVALGFIKTAYDHTRHHPGLR
jgi:toxin ParE1/3/4